MSRAERYDPREGLNFLYLLIKCSDSKLDKYIGTFDSLDLAKEYAAASTVFEYHWLARADGSHAAIAGQKPKGFTPSRQPKTMVWHIRPLRHNRNPGEATTFTLDDFR